jgi:hypothetical protein
MGEERPAVRAEQYRNHWRAALAVAEEQSRGKNCMHLRIRIGLCITLFTFIGCARKSEATAPPRQRVQTVRANSAVAQKCVAAVKSALGQSAAILQCGELAGIPGLRAVAAVRLKQLHDDANGIPISKLVVLHQAGNRWITELIVDNFITNSAGYLGIKFVDDSSPPAIYRVSFSDARSDDSHGFTMYLDYLHPNGDTDGWPNEIGWNAAVQRFQEYTSSEAPVGFRPEIKNPPHKDLSCRKK